jgi:Protein of unknown function (DUF3592)
MLGLFLGLCALVLMAKSALDSHREDKHAHWPSAVATITQRQVVQFMNGREEAWRIECAVRYMADGTEIAAKVRSGIGGFLDEKPMRRWASQHPSGTTLRVRYDPQHPDTAVPDAVELPGSGPQASNDLKATLVFSILSLIVISIDRFLQGRTGALEQKEPGAAG